MPVRTPPRSLRDALRAGTRDAHVRLERRMPLMGEALTRSGYQDVLAAFYGFYVPLEARAAGAGPTPFDGLGGLRDRIAWLTRDLAALGQRSAPPECADLPPVTTASERMGCWYVIEGSALGGQHIHRHVVAHLGLQAGASFFCGHGAATGDRWRSFLQALDAAEGSLDPARAVAAAGETFRTLHDWLEIQGCLR